jgi:hypothetical protein
MQEKNVACTLDLETTRPAGRVTLKIFFDACIFNVVMKMSWSSLFLFLKFKIMFIS